MAWTALTRGGYDVYRDLVNTPAFLAMLPPIEGLLCLDLGCGEGHNTRMLANQGARAVAVDISDSLIEGCESNGSTGDLLHARKWGVPSLRRRHLRCGHGIHEFHGRFRSRTSARGGRHRIEAGWGAPVLYHPSLDIPSWAAMGNKRGWRT